MSTRRAAALALLLTAALAGCGGDRYEDDDPTIRVPAARASAPAASPSPSPSPSPAATAPAARLTGDGIDLPQGLLEFGTGFDEARPALVAAFGEPTKDTGVTPSFSAYGTCPGDELRALEFAGGALYVLFGDVDGPELTMYQWTLDDVGRTAQAPPALALVGDAATLEISVGDTVAALIEGSATDQLELFEESPPLPATFRLQDQSSGLFGYLTGIDDADTVTGVQAGRACGE